MRVNRGTSRTTRNKPDKELSPIVFDLTTLDLYCQYVLSENTHIRGSNLTIMKKLFDKIDDKIYRGDVDRSTRLEFVKRALDGRVSKKINNRNLLIQYINGGPVDKPLLNTDNFKELSNDEIDWINYSVSETVKHLFMYDYVDKIMNICQRFKSEDYNKRSDIVNEFEDTIDQVKAEFRRVKNENITEAEFSLEDGIFEERLSDIYVREISPSRILRCGMQGLNLMLGGGFEAGRVYMFFGTAAAGKSFTLLDIMIQMKKYNANYICHDKTKKPCLVLLTMENSVHETVTRLFSMITGGKMVDYKLNEVIKKLKNDGELELTENNQINIIVKYKANLSVDTSYMYTLYDDLSERGYEPMAFFQDHIKRIKPMIDNNHDMRLNLGEIVNEFKAFAVEKDIPVISDSHLNRDAAKILDDAARANKQDLARLLGRSNVSESMLMIDNTDVGIIITKDYDKYMNQYMGFILTRTRTASGIDYFAQPFEKNNSIKLVEDYGMEIPAYKTTLSDGTMQNNNKTDYGANVRRFDADEDDDLFSSMPTLNSNISEVLSMSNDNQNMFNVVGSPSTPIYPLPDQNIQVSNWVQNNIYPEEECKSGIYFVDDNQTPIMDALGRPYFGEVVGM